MTLQLIYYVYLIFHPITGRPFYVGKGKDNRAYSHLKKSNNREVNRLIAKYGSAPIVLIRSNLTHAEAFTTEIAFIAAIGRKDKGLGPLVNYTDGGDGVVNPSAETIKIIADKARERQADPKIKEWLSQRMKDQRCDPITGPLMNSPNKGKQLTEETKEKLRQKAIERMKDPVKRAAARNKPGKKHTPETINQMCISRQIYWDQRRNSGLSMRRPARDEVARCIKISETMKKLRARQREERELS